MRPVPRHPRANSAVIVPARAAYSHSASLGRRYIWPVCLLSQATSASPSPKLTLTTGTTVVSHWTTTVVLREAGRCPWVADASSLSGEGRIFAACPPETSQARMAGQSRPGVAGGRRRLPCLPVSTPLQARPSGTAPPVSAPSLVRVRRASPFQAPAFARPPAREARLSRH